MHNLLGGTAALASDSERQDGRVENQGMGVRTDLVVRHDDTFRAILRPADRAGTQPLGTRHFFDQRNGISSEQRRCDGFHLLRIGDAPTRRRFVEGEPEAEISGRGDRRRPARQLGDGAGQRVGAPVPADQRHCHRTILGDRDHRWLLPLCREQRRDRADQDAAGGEADDRLSRFEEPGDVQRRAVVDLVPIAGTITRPVQPRAGQRRSEAPAERRTARPEHDDRDVVGE